MRDEGYEGLRRREEGGGRREEGGGIPVLEARADLQACVWPQLLRNGSQMLDELVPLLGLGTHLV
jgi:hypothetical protein